MPFPIVQSGKSFAQCLPVKNKSHPFRNNQLPALSIVCKRHQCSVSVCRPRMRIGLRIPMRSGKLHPCREREALHKRSAGKGIGRRNVAPVKMQDIACKIFVPYKFRFTAAFISSRRHCLVKTIEGI